MIMVTLFFGITLSILNYAFDVSASYILSWFLFRNLNLRDSKSVAAWGKKSEIYKFFKHVKIHINVFFNILKTLHVNFLRRTFIPWFPGDLKTRGVLASLACHYPTITGFLDNRISSCREQRLKPFVFPSID